MTYIALAMKHRRIPTLVTFVLMSVAAVATHADTPAEVYEAMGIKPAAVLTGTVLTAKVLPGPSKQVIAVTTYFTGSKDRNDAVNVRLDVFRRAPDGKTLKRIYGRDFGAESGGPVGDGDLQLVDLDLDGINEIITTYRSFLDPLIEQRIGEIVLNEQGEFRSAWTGALDYDATKAARDMPPERRDRFRREIDFASTMRTRGATLYLNKKMIAIAGERLDPPKLIQEKFPLRSDATR